MRKLTALALSVFAVVASASFVVAQNGLPGGPGAQIPNSAGGGGGAPTGAAGGGLTGTYPNPTVASVPASATPAYTGDVTKPAGSAVTTLAAGSAGNLNSGTLLVARLPAFTGDVTATAGTGATTYNNVVPSTKGGAGAITGALKGSGAGVVSQAACADLSNASVYCPATLGQLPASTSGTNVPGAGFLFEPRSANLAAGSAVNLTVNNPSVVTSVNVTAGNWLCFGNVGFSGGATTAFSYINFGFSSVTLTIPADPFAGHAPVGTSTPFASGAVFTQIVPVQQLSLTSSGTIYLTTQAGFSNSTMAAYGGFQCYRTP